jgi:hypothetical protein
MQRGGQCSPGLDEEDEGTAAWRAGAGALASRHDLTLARPSAPSCLVCVEGWNWRVEHSHGMLDGPLLGWECLIQRAAISISIY